MPQPPSRGGVSSPYGMRINPNDGRYRMHYGEDTLGAGNYAPVTGTVVFAGFDDTGTGLGYAVGIREADDRAVIWWVAHHASLAVKLGDTTREGTTFLGVKGASGAAKGVHCHTERRVGGAARPGSGKATDPRDYYTTTAADDIEPFEEQETIPMPALIRHPNGSIGFVSDAGELDAIGTLNEVESLKATGIVEDYIDTTSLIWDTLTARTARLRAARTGSVDLDEAALAAQIAPLVVAPVVTAVKDAAAVELTVEQVQAASEAAVRNVLGGLG